MKIGIKCLYSKITFSPYKRDIYDKYNSWKEKHNNDKKSLEFYMGEINGRLNKLLENYNENCKVCIDYNHMVDAILILTTIYNMNDTTNNITTTIKSKEVNEDQQIKQNTTSKPFRVKKKKKNTSSKKKSSNALPKIQDNDFSYTYQGFNTTSDRTVLELFGSKEDNSEDKYDIFNFGKNQDLFNVEESVFQIPKEDDIN